jgi:membrane protein DedA with SNARE-associated domain
MLGALTAGIAWVGMYVGLSYFLGEEITKRLGKAGTRAVLGVLVIVVIGLCIRAGISRYRHPRQDRSAEQGTS